MAKKETPATTQAEYDKAYEEVKSGKQPVPSFDDMGPLPELEPRGYSPKDISSKKPEPTFKSDVDNMVSGVKKIDKKIDDTLVDALRKAAGKEEQGILGKRSKLSRGLPEAKKKGGMIKTKKYVKGGTASSRADGIATKGKTRGKIC